MGIILGAALVVVLACISVFLMRHRTLKSYAFTFWVFTSVAMAMVWPKAFDKWFGVDLKIFIGPLVQIIMFGMGTKLSLGDFGRVFVMPWPVFVALVLQYTVRPLTAFAIAKLLGFPPEIAAGVVLIGSVSSGTASNLIAFLSNANVALAVTVTACSTLLSPILTPLLMEKLAGQLVEIKYLNMVVEILNMVIVPVVSGLVANRILYGTRSWCQRVGPLVFISAGCALLAAAIALLPAATLGRFAALRVTPSGSPGGALVGLGLITLVALAKLVISVYMKRPNTWMDKTLPLVSMVSICLIIAIITVRSLADLRSAGPMLVLTLILVVMFHNALGYFLGYWMSRAIRMDEITCRTVAIEVGMPNGGMATGLAMNVLHSAGAALAPAIYGPWMNVSGSILASWWRKRPVAAKTPPTTPPPPHETADKETTIKT
jgi:BASS family bile acid:Na+ symporter